MPHRSDHELCRSHEASTSHPGKTGLHDPIVQMFIGEFLESVNYIAMSDFFLAYRGICRPDDLLEFLINRYSQSSITAGIQGRNIRVRTFVAIRHWILNYYADDFLPSRDLQQAMSVFLNSLGGVGVDEVTTEARIAKELRRTWSREEDACESESREPCSRRESWFAFALRNPKILPAGRRLDLIEIAQSAGLHATKTTKVPIRGELNAGDRGLHTHCIRARRRPRSITSSVAEGNHANHSSTLWCRSDFSTAWWVEEGDHVHRQTPITQFRHPSYLPDSPILRPESNCSKRSIFSPPRQIRRKPGGILKNAVTVADLTPRAPSQTSSAADEIPYKVMNHEVRQSFSFPAKTCSVAGRLISTERTSQVLVTYLLHDLAYENTIDPQTDVSLALEHTLSVLEGRNLVSPGMGSLFEANILESGPTDRDYAETKDKQLGSEKRRKHEARVLTGLSHERVDIPSQDELSGRDDDSLEDISNKFYDSPFLAQLKVSENNVSIVEALEMQQNQVTSIDLEAQPETPVDLRSWLMQYNDAHISHVLFAIEKSIMLEIDWLELTSGSWMESTTSLLALRSWQDVMASQPTGLGMVLSRFNCVVSWLARQIVCIDDIDRRAELIKKFIDLAALSRGHNNYTAALQFVSALHERSIQRLDATWKLIPKTSMKIYRSLESLCDPHGNWCILRTVQERAMLNSESVVIPFMGCYLSALLTIDQNVENIVERLRGTAQITKIVLGMIDRIDLDTEVDMQLVNRLVWIEGASQDVLHRLSTLCEP